MVACENISTPGWWYELGDVEVWHQWMGATSGDWSWLMMINDGLSKGYTSPSMVCWVISYGGSNGWYTQYIYDGWFMMINDGLWQSFMGWVGYQPRFFGLSMTHVVKPFIKPRLLTGIIPGLSRLYKVITKYNQIRSIEPLLLWMIINDQWRINGYLCPVLSKVICTVDFFQQGQNQPNTAWSGDGFGAYPGWPRKKSNDGPRWFFVDIRASKWWLELVKNHQLSQH